MDINLLQDVDPITCLRLPPYSFNQQYFRLILRYGINSDPREKSDWGTEEMRF